MPSLIPSRTQWQKWSAPTKYQFVAMIASVAALFVAILGVIVPDQRSNPVSQNKAVLPVALTTPVQPQQRSYDDERSALAARLSEANICLTARLYSDSLYPLDSDCHIDVTGLQPFFRSYAPFIASIPYSGAEDAVQIAAWVEGEVSTINGLRTRLEMERYQVTSGIHLPIIGYYLCGFEWYIRNAPPSSLPLIDSEKIRLFQVSWSQWSESTNSQFKDVPFLTRADGSIDDKDCSSFIEILD